MRLVAKIVPYFNFDHLWSSRSDAFSGAERLEMLPVPYRPRAEPFNHELPAYPLASSTFPRLLTAGVLAAIFYVSTLALNIDGVVAGDILTSESTFAGSPLARTITGSPGIDEVLSFLLVVFSEGIAGADIYQKIQCA